MYTRINVCMCVCACVCVGVYVCVQIYMCMYVCMYVCVCMYLCMYVYMYVYMYVCMYMYLCIYAEERRGVAKFIWGDGVQRVKCIQSWCILHMVIFMQWVLKTEME